MARPPDAVIVHAIPGRIRFRIPGRRGDGVYFLRAAALLARGKSVQDVHCNPVTGSLVVRFVGDGEALLQFAQSESVFRIVAERDPAAYRTSNRAQSIDGELDLVASAAKRLLAARPTGLALVLMALLQFARGNIAPPAVTFLWYGASVLANSVMSSAVQGLVRQRRQGLAARPRPESDQ